MQINHIFRGRGLAAVSLAVFGILTAAILSTTMVHQAFAADLAGTDMSLKSSAADEQEPNDDFTSATPVRMNQAVYATSDETSYDYFKFTLPINGTAIVSFRNDQRLKSGASYIKVFDHNFNAASIEKWKDLTNTNTLAVNLNLKRGTYYLRIGGHKFCPYHFKITYSIPSTTVKKVVSAKKSFTVKWVKKSTATAYQVRYTPKTTYRDYGWAKAKTLKVGKACGSKTISKLKAKTKYCVQVRVLRKISGQTYYSSWSSKKVVKTK